MMWKVSRWSGKFPNDLESFQIVWDLLDGLESFLIVWKVAGCPVKFQDSFESLCTV